MKSLKAQLHNFSRADVQLEHLRGGLLPAFNDKLSAQSLFPLKPTGIDILQVNVGKMCNQVCKHCHVDAGPDRKEIMTKETMQQCLDVLKQYDIKTVDLTGGAPEMNPNFRWFVEQIYSLGKHIIDRCNLTIINANQKYHDLPEFFAAHNVEVVSSLPHYTATRTDSQRGDGVFERSIDALKRLNEVGYGTKDSQLQLNLVYNPTGAIIPGAQAELEAVYKRELREKFGIEFNQLFVITNMPVSRFLDFLVQSGNYESYMQKLIDSYNPVAAESEANVIAAVEREVWGFIQYQTCMCAGAVFVGIVKIGAEAGHRRQAFVESRCHYRFYNVIFRFIRSENAETAAETNGVFR